MALISLEVGARTLLGLKITPDTKNVLCATVVWTIILEGTIQKSPEYPYEHLSTCLSLALQEVSALQRRDLSAFTFIDPFADGIIPRRHRTSSVRSQPALGPSEKQISWEELDLGRRARRVRPRHAAEANLSTGRRRETSATDYAELATRDADENILISFPTVCMKSGPTRVTCEHLRTTRRRITRHAPRRSQYSPYLTLRKIQNIMREEMLLHY
ncbi:hypothetical protein EVAR_3408_1 [Eumeta japonica]|uniref:Uncharacterized protein n=1 Tax=Eumeta variegata TaxID=151549 RepID=A0A4C1SVJ8_EUMVA|nr:hypothetical protein EVAR_3408_1 [Eumeta japonica]